MKTILFLVALASLTPAALAIPISGDGCGGTGGPALGIVDTGSGYYVDGTSNGVWVFQESNGVAGLQTGPDGASAYVPGDVFTCGVDNGRGAPDTLVV